MDYLQYDGSGILGTVAGAAGFKPYYKWITFNISEQQTDFLLIKSFKPYYKWITFNI